MTYETAVLAASLFFGLIITMVVIYGLKTWINLDSEEDLFMEKIKKHSAVIIPLVSLALIALAYIIIDVLSPGSLPRAW